MKASDLELSELIDLSDGRIDLHGRRLVLHSIHAMGQFRRDVMQMLGTVNARRIFTRFGLFWGQADAAAMKRIFGWDNMEEWLRAGARLQTLEGIAECVIKKLELDEEKKRLLLECTWYDSGEAEGHLAEVGRADEAICWKLVGYASGFASFCLGKSVYFIERQCQGRGDNYCHAEGRDLDSWDDEIKSHLPYFEAEDIKGDVERLTLELQRKSEELARHRQGLQHRPSKFFVEGRSKALRQVIDLAERVAHFDSSVLVTGETGVGKEVLARYIHGASHRSRGQFLPINCSALPESLLESELFGHKAGSFTGAVRDRIGLFEQAAGGTIFLDEIGDISALTQVKILRVLQEHEVMRVGESVPRKVDVRVIAATNRDLDKAVEDGLFRDDLLYRLRVIEIEMPPLRERREDILPLTRHLVERLAKRLGMEHLRMDPTCVDFLQDYPWPGNVRELENAIERAAVLSPDGVIMPETLPRKVRNEASSQMPVSYRVGRSLAQVELEHIRAVLDSTGGNKTRTAEILGISPATLWRKLKIVDDGKAS